MLCKLIQVTLLPAFTVRFAVVRTDEPLICKVSDEMEIVYLVEYCG